MLINHYNSYSTLYCDSWLLTSWCGKGRHHRMLEYHSALRVMLSKTTKRVHVPDILTLSHQNVCCSFYSLWPQEENKDHPSPSWSGWDQAGTQFEPHSVCNIHHWFESNQTMEGKCPCKLLILADSMDGNNSCRRENYIHGWHKDE